MSKSKFRKLSLRDLLQEFLNNTSDASHIRDELRKRLSEAEETHLFDLIMSSSQIRRGKDAHFIEEEESIQSIHELAKQCVREKYFGHNMKNPEDAKIYIQMAADDPDVDEEAKKNERLASFWKAVRFHRRKAKYQAAEMSY